jgi:3-deoxy-D-manno-octulosonic-acid transferase
MLTLYTIILSIAMLLILPYYGLKILIEGKYRKSLGQKLGFIPSAVFEAMTGHPRIWIHAVSVGEVTAAAPIVAALRERKPAACIVVSTGTETGRDMAERLIPGATAFMYYPLDLPFITQKVISRVRPDLFILTETELWPNFLKNCRDAGVKSVMINGRISPRSFRRYVRTAFFWRKILRFVDRIGVISEVDKSRIEAMGASPSNVRVLGNAKYDSLASKVDSGIRVEMARRLQIEPGPRIFVAGSTHKGEEEIVLYVYKKILDVYPDFRLILVPRHIQRGQEVLSLVKAAGFMDCIAFTEINGGRQPAGERVVVVDVIGELFHVYSLATLVYLGGSLVPKGGQNILEPAAWGKVVFYGPSMDDFLGEKAMLEEAGCGIMIRSKEELLEKILNILKDPDDLNRRGEAGRQKVMDNRGASERYAELILEVLDLKSKRI